MTTCWHSRGRRTNRPRNRLVKASLEINARGIMTDDERISAKLRFVLPAPALYGRLGLTVRPLPCQTPGTVRRVDFRIA